MRRRFFFNVIWVRGWGKIALGRARLSAPDRVREGDEIGQVRFCEVAKMSTAIMDLYFPRDRQVQLCRVWYIQRANILSYLRYLKFFSRVSSGGKKTDYVSTLNNLKKVGTPQIPIPKRRSIYTPSSNGSLTKIAAAATPKRKIIVAPGS